MKYAQVVPAEFISRPNRFVARVLAGGQEQVVHVKNTGRCRELLVPGCRVYLCPSDSPARKTAFDLVAVEKETENGSVTVNMDSQAPNAAVKEWLAGGLFPAGAQIRPEVTFGGSRFDFCAVCGGTTSYIEVKGVTLEREGIALFPDAPTQRGVKHILELEECVRQGYGAHIIFVIQMKGVSRLRPNDVTHPQFGNALRQAAAAGVGIHALDCLVTPDTMVIDSPVAVEL